MTANAVDNVHALQPARVVVGGRDKRFVKVATFLLARRGFDVKHAANHDELLDLVEKQTVDVVILDATYSLSSSLRTAAALTALHPNLRILFATDRFTTRVGEPYTQIEKWRGLDALPEEVTRVQLGLPVNASPLPAS
jgi:chemotaxis response regulator CheB